MNRIEKLRRKLGDFSAALIENPANRGYFTHFLSSAGTLLVTRDDALFIVDSRYIEAAENTVRGARVELQEDDLFAQMGRYLQKNGIKEVNVEDQMPLGRLFRLKSGVGGTAFSGDGRLSAAASALRAVKEPEEVERIRAAQAITGAAFERILGWMKPGVTERELAAELEYYMRKGGADGTAFSTIAVSGKNSSMPHGVPSDKPIEPGDFVTMDFGAIKDGYCSDMTRTVAVGRVTDAMRRVYGTVREAHRLAMERARAGMTGRELDAVARDYIYAAGYKGMFGHGLGHSLGLEVHEDPRASALYDKTLESGAILTIEPGIYIPGEFGVRIENMILLKEGGSENLTDTPAELIVL